MCPDVLMSKSTKKYGKPLYTLSSSISAFPQPTDKLKAEWALLDKIARKVYNKPYDALNHKQAVELHFNKNLGVYNEISTDSRHPQSAQPSQNA